MNKLVLNSQLGKQIKYNDVDNKLEINLDGITLKADPNTGIISLDLESLDLNAIIEYSNDEGNLAQQGTDGRIFVPPIVYT